MLNEAEFIQRLKHENQSTEGTERRGLESLD